METFNAHLEELLNWSTAIGTPLLLSVLKRKVFPKLPVAFLPPAAILVSMGINAGLRFVSDLEVNATTGAVLGTIAIAGRDFAHALWEAAKAQSSGQPVPTVEQKLAERKLSL